jgi:hypothetical protein
MEAAQSVDEVAQVAPEQVPAPVVEEPYFADPAKHAYVVTLFLGDDYVPGALTLAHSIKQSGSTAARVALVSSDVSEKARKLLSLVYSKVVEVPVIDVKVPLKRRNDKKQDAKLAWISKAFTKLNALNLVEFEKVCLLDADHICAANPDAVFKVTAPAAICTALLRPNDAAAHGQVVPIKTFDAAYRDLGFRGCTYLFRPSATEFARAVKLLAVKPKKAPQVLIKQDAFQMMKSKNDSKFSMLESDSEDEEDTVAVKAAKAAAAAAAAEAEAAAAKAAAGSAEAIAAAEEFEAATRVAEPVYPYTVYKNTELAPLGLTYEPKKTQAGVDEAFFADLFKGQWRHLHPRFGHPSWRKLEAGPQGSALMHFAADLPWAREQDWPDYAGWDTAALDLAKTDASVRAYLFAAVPILVDKEKNGVTPQPEEAAAGAATPEAAAPAPAPAAAAAPAAAPAVAAPVIPAGMSAAAVLAAVNAKKAPQPAPAVKPVPLGKAAAAAPVAAAPAAAAPAAAAPAAAAAAAPAATAAAPTSKAGLNSSAKAWTPAASGWAAKVAAAVGAAPAAAAAAPKGKAVAAGEKKGVSSADFPEIPAGKKK